MSRETIAARLGRDLSAVARAETGRSLIIADELHVYLDAYEATMAQLAAAVRKRAA